ncbi:uncharacterized protein EV422DRAFT_564316 [Fimicolochytrium jonesii]|uniref:uncharacterized protein n=1 Tax=Fimicolochytrium jonesii TaxID=1396493 RepID=UPI0022FE141C|nr:uncharacterized protein EV422DRAFT_564316 [Fimicolochytrium jonesii]KAI8824958.1 hypothetical protein EV422DRAFT_564316 [Fimicolochytrium jonesii]
MASQITQWSVEAAGAPEISGETKPRRNLLWADKPLLALPQEASTLVDAFQRGVKISGPSPYLGHRVVTNGVAGPYVWQTYNEVNKRVKNLGSGFANRGLTVDSSVGLFSINRAEWIIAEQAAFLNSCITVPLYDTLGAEAIEFISTQTKIPLVVATKDKVAILLKIKEKLPSLKHIVVMDGADEALINSGKEKDVEIIGILELEREGEEKPLTGTLPTKDSIATICYTSGTTGQPKGAIITHGNLLSFCGGCEALNGTPHAIGYNKDDSYMSYLPLAHVFERMVFVCLTYEGARLGFFQGDTLKLLDDVMELKPTMFASVPRLYNRIYDKVFNGVKQKGGLAATLFNKAYAAKKANLASGTVKHFLWDKIVFGKVRARLGGRVRLILTGAAPLSADVMDFLRICFSATVLQGYGATETSGASTSTDLLDVTSGHIGGPSPICEVKLVDVESMGYTVKDQPFPRGEILIRGNNIFKGYYQSQEKTDEVLTSDGWYRTGDVGQFDPKGRLQIIDRAKNIFKLAQGEYIAPEKIEMVYLKHEAVAQAFVYGDSLQAVVVAVIVPDEDTLKHWVEAKGLPVKPFAELCQDDDVRKALLEDLTKYGRAEGLKGFELVKDIYLETTPFSPENGLHTPTFKLKRHEAQAKYRSQIDAMYAKLSATA